MNFGLDRLAQLPTAPYDKGPTLSGKTQIVMVDPAKIDAVCRATETAGAKLVSPMPKGWKYAECYDPWNDVGYVPLYPSKAEQNRLNEHMLGHARGGTHAAPGQPRGEWFEAPWARFYRKPAGNIFAEQPVQQPAGNIFRGR